MSASTSNVSSSSSCAIVASNRPVKKSCCSSFGNYLGKGVCTIAKSALYYTLRSIIWAIDTSARYIFLEEIAARTKPATQGAPLHCFPKDISRLIGEYIAEDEFGAYISEATTPGDFLVGEDCIVKQLKHSLQELDGVLVYSFKVDLLKTCGKFIYSLDLSYRTSDIEEENFRTVDLNVDSFIRLAAFMPNLISLTIRNKNISDKGLGYIVKACPHLEKLDITNCTFVNLGLLFILTLKNLKELSFTGTEACRNTNLMLLLTNKFTSLRLYNGQSVHPSDRTVDELTHQFEKMLKIRDEVLHQSPLYTKAAEVIDKEKELLTFEKTEDIVMSLWW